MHLKLFMGKGWIKYEEDIRSTSRIFSSKVGNSGVTQFAVRDNDKIFTGSLESGSSPVDFSYTCDDMVFPSIALNFDPISSGKRFFHLEGNSACNIQYHVFEGETRH
jgi:hypothetical protein